MNPEQEKLVKELMKKANKFSTNIESTVNKLQEDAHEIAEEKKNFKKVEDLNKEYEPYRGKVPKFSNPNFSYRKR